MADPIASPQTVTRMFLCLTLALATVGTASPQPASNQAPDQAPNQPQAPAQSRQPNPATSLPDDAPLFRITGIVIDASTKAPVAHATLSIAPMNTVKSSTGAARRSRRRQNTQVEATADADGRFEIDAPSAGGWELTAAARGYRTQPFDEHHGYSTAVVLTEASPVVDLTFRLTPSAGIEGSVLDEAGEAVRGAQVVLMYLPPPTPDNQHPRAQTRGQQTTDDRGFYKFSGDNPGRYQIRVSAQPWYASGTPKSGNFLSTGPDEDATSDATVADPLDVVYPIVWYPGTADPAAATSITLVAGESQEANIRLLPIPGYHLHVVPASPESASDTDGSRNGQSVQSFIYINRLMPDGNEESQQTPTRTDSHGTEDIAGLAPGTYVVHQQSPSGYVALSTIRISSNSARTVDLSQAEPATTVTVKIDPEADTDSAQISFRNLDDNHVSYAQRAPESSQRPPRRRGLGQPDPLLPDKTAARPDRTVSLGPGKYEVFLNGTGDSRLSGIEATGATASGRVVTIASGSPTLLVHTAKGVGTVTGFVRTKDSPDPGAMVLLIPATLGDPAGIDLPSRDQSNSDGSFEMTNLLPGGYILVAIDHGWDLNWSDPATLRRFLTHGVALDIRAGTELKQTIEAQSP